ncbi:MAG: Y-family DNA polymerase [Bacteroidaceae bacterium]|nr:Y-family DNA polymerase [Bacteroidaceae bacterium]
MFALCDCDSFFASCERVFRPELYGKPVVVLSNNDGCIVAMTKEAKALGMKRGTPFYQVSDLIRQHNVSVFSSNYTLYGDISARVMQLLAEETGDIDIYSIDEAFFNIDGYRSDKLHESLVTLRRRIYKGIGVSVSIGVGPTRTLAKVASHFAKKIPGYHGVCIIDSDEKRLKALQLLPVGDVWGIGRQFRKKLEYYGVATAYDFQAKSESWISQQFKLPSVHTWKELRGIPCKDLNELPEKQSICTSRSFGEMITEWDKMAESVANFTASCARKLRTQHSVAGNLTVFILTNRFRQDLPQYMNSTSVQFITPTDSTLLLTNYAIIALRKIWRDGYHFKKSGVILTDISPNNSIQQHLFDTTDHIKQQRLTKAIDAINKKEGTDAVHLAVQSDSFSKWNLKREFKSPCYTTNIKEVLVVKT